MKKVMSMVMAFCLLGSSLSATAFVEEMPATVSAKASTADTNEKMLGGG